MENTTVEWWLTALQSTANETVTINLIHENWMCLKPEKILEGYYLPFVHLIMSDRSDIKRHLLGIQFLLIIMKRSHMQEEEL